MSLITQIKQWWRNLFTENENQTFPDFYSNEYYFGHARSNSSKEIKRKCESNVVLENKTVLEKNEICVNCYKSFHLKDLPQCGPCGNFFCSNCWENHRWCHGKAPGIGIEYHTDGSFTGFDGSERSK